MSTNAIPPIPVSLTAAMLLKAPPADTTPVPVELPRFGCTVHVRRLDGRGYQQYAADARQAGDDDQDRVLLAHALGDEAGGRLFGDYRQVPVDALTPAEGRRIAYVFNSTNLPDPKDDLRGK